jgi:hypothetical protein
VSEYQCYEFLAVDRRLTAQEMAELRNISTRAEITPTRFWNEYQWDDLKADPAKLLARYFDMHLYFANWGTRRLMFRLPVTAVDLDALRAYAPGGPVTLTTTGECAVPDLWSKVEEPEDDWSEARHLAASLTPLRAEPLRGDRRVAYLAWLLAVQAGEISSRTREPPVPRDLDAESGPRRRWLSSCASTLTCSQPRQRKATRKATKRIASGRGSSASRRRNRSDGCCGPPTTRTCRWDRS